jgi:hypothetical protein
MSKRPPPSLEPLEPPNTAALASRNPQPLSPSRKRRASGQPQQTPSSLPQASSSVMASSGGRFPPGASAPIASGTSSAGRSAAGVATAGGAAAASAQAEGASMQPPAKKSRTNTPWSPAEELRLKEMRDAGNSWAEIAKVSSEGFLFFVSPRAGCVWDAWMEVRSIVGRVDRWETALGAEILSLNP